MIRNAVANTIAVLLLWALVSASVAAEEGKLAVEPQPGSDIAFRIWNPSPFAAPSGRAQLTFRRKGRELHATTQPIEALVPFQSIVLKVPGWKRFAPGVARLCVEGSGRGRPACAERTLPGTRPDLRPGRARIDGRRLVLELRNEGDVASGSFGIRVTTRASGRVVGTTTDNASSLGPRSSREVVIDLERWGGAKNGLAKAFEQGCCVTSVALDPEDKIDEINEANNSQTLQHRFEGR